MLIKIEIKRPFWPGQYICTPTACKFLSRPARPNVWGTFHKFLGSPERFMCARSISERKCQSSSYQHSPQGAGQAHALPFLHSRCSPTLECSCKKMSVCLWNYLTFTDPLKKPAITLSLSSLSSSPPILAISALLGILYLDPSSSHLRCSHPAARISVHEQLMAGLKPELNDWFLIAH